ncbi:hypothetical protein [Georgenia yuyongxinii]
MNLLTKHRGQALTLTTRLDAVTPPPARWTSRVATWTTTFQVPGSPVPAPPKLEECAVITTNEKGVEVTWSWAGVEPAGKWEIRLRREGSGDWVSVKSNVAVPRLPGGTYSAIFWPGKNAAGTIKVRLVDGVSFVDSAEVFTLSVDNANNQKVESCVGPGPADAAPAAAASAALAVTTPLGQDPAESTTPLSPFDTPAPGATVTPSPTSPAAATSDSDAAPGTDMAVAAPVTETATGRGRK